MRQLLALAAQLQISLSPEAESAGERLVAGERHPESLDAETLADMQVAVLGCARLQLGAAAGGVVRLGTAAESAQRTAASGTVEPSSQLLLVRAHNGRHQATHPQCAAG